MLKERFLKWLKAAAVRAAKTVAETAVATMSAHITRSTLESTVRFNFFSLNCFILASASLLAGILSLLMSVKGLPEIKE